MGFFDPPPKMENLTVEEVLSKDVLSIIDKKSRKARKAERFYKVRMFLFVCAFWYVLYLLLRGFVAVHG